MQKIRSVQILWGLFCVGFWLTLFPFMAYFRPVIYPASMFSPLSKYAENPNGFLFLTSEDIIPNTAKFNVTIDELDPQSDSAHVSVEVNFLSSEANMSMTNSTFFVLQVLDHISNANVVVNGIPYYDGEEVNINWSETYSTSYLIIEVPGPYIAGNVFVTMDFTWSGLFLQQSFYGYEIVVPFGNDFPAYDHLVGLPQQVINPEGILGPDESWETSLLVAKSDQSTISATEPGPDSIAFWAGKVWYFWDVKKNSNSTSYFSTAFVIDMAVNSKKSQFDLDYALFFMLLGIGIPITISSGAEILKRHSDEAPPSNSTEPTRLVSGRRVLKREKSERSFFWKGLILGLLAGILGDLFISYLMKAYESLNIPPWGWVLSAIIGFCLVMVLVWIMWRESESKKVVHSPTKPSSATPNEHEENDEKLDLILEKIAVSKLDNSFMLAFSFLSVLFSLCNLLLQSLLFRTTLAISAIFYYLFSFYIGYFRGALMDDWAFRIWGWLWMALSTGGLTAVLISFLIVETGTKISPFFGYGLCLVFVSIAAFLFIEFIKAICANTPMLRNHLISMRPVQRKNLRVFVDPAIDGHTPEKTLLALFTFVLIGVAIFVISSLL